MEHLYVITYDIADDKRWRRVFKTMNGYGEWLQLSVFQCRLDRMRAIQLQAELKEAIHLCSSGAAAPASLKLMDHSLHPVAASLLMHVFVSGG